MKFPMLLGQVTCPTCGHISTNSSFWLTIGFLGQAIFTARFLAQWLASEKRRDSVVPVIFWWLSLAGGLTLLSYAVHREDPVIIVGQALGVFVYVRNLMLVAKGRRRAARRAHKYAPHPTLSPEDRGEGRGTLLNPPGGTNSGYGAPSTPGL